MKYLFILFVLVNFTEKSFCQETNDSKLLSFSYNNISTIEVLQKIEEISNYKFYYHESWLDNKLLSDSFNNKPITYVLNKLFSETNINFFIDRNKIILTKSKLIHDKLPENFFQGTANIITTKKPILSTINDSNKEFESQTLIGKESIDSDSDSFLLSGYIKNKKNNQPLSDITIKTKNGTISTNTDSSGFYSIKLPYGENVLEIKDMNFEKITKKIIIYSNGKLDISLNEKINVLNEIIVRGKRKKSTRAAITGVTTIEAEGVKNVPLVLGERDVLKIALTIPGIKTAGEGSSGFNVRGGKEDQNLILLDGGTLYNPSHFFGFFSAINPYATNKVDIYKGGIPSYFGGRLSSVFDIITKNGNNEKLSGEGGVGPVTSNLMVTTPIVKKKASLLISIRGTYSGWILKNLEEKQLQNSEASFYDGIIKYNHNLNKKNSIEATLYHSNDKYSVTSDSLYHYKNTLTSLKWKHTFNEKFKSETTISNSNYLFGIDYDSDNITNSFKFNYKINESQLLFKLNHNLNDTHKLNYGFCAKLYKTNPGTLLPKVENSKLISIKIHDEKALETAFFVSDNYKITSKLVLDAGLRYSQFTPLGESNQRLYLADSQINDATVIGNKQFGKNKPITTYMGIEPRIALRYNINDSFSIRTGYDKMYQYIHLLSNNTTQSPTDTWKISDLNIQPQSGDQFSVGLFKNMSFMDLELSMEGYYKKSKNILDYKVAANLQLNDNIETEILQGEGKSYGVEFLIKKETGKLNGWLGYTYSRALLKLDSKFPNEKVNNGNFFAANYDKPHDLSVVLNYKITQRYSFSSNFVYQTGRPITYPIGKYEYGNAEYTLYSDRNKFRIPDYYRLDIGVNIEGNHKIKKLAHSFWNISVYNVLGRNNPYSVFFVTKNGQIQAFKTSIFAIPIPTITYNFKF